MPHRFEKDAPLETWMGGVYAQGGGNANCYQRQPSVGVFEKAGPIDPKRHPTGPASAICTFVGPLPDCKKYVLAERTYNCEPFTAAVWFEDGIEIPPPSQEEIEAMSSSIGVGASGNTTKQDKADPSPLFLTGPVAAQDIATYIADQIAASAVTTFPVAGVDIEAEHILLCGSVSFVDLSGVKSIVINGQTDNPIASWTDSDGVNGLNTIEILDGCTVAMTSCAFKDYELDKGGNVVVASTKREAGVAVERG